MDDLILDEAGKAGGPPAAHYVKFTHEEWLALVNAPVFKGRLQSPPQLKGFLARIASGQITASVRQAPK